MSDFVYICSRCNEHHSAFTSDCPALKEDISTFWKQKREEGIEPDWIVMEKKEKE